MAQGALSPDYQQQGQPDPYGAPPAGDAVMTPMPNYGALSPQYGGGTPYSPYGVYPYPPVMGGDEQPSDYARNLYEQSQQISQAGGGPLQRLQELKARRDQAAQARIDAIRKAQAILSSAGRGPENLPGLMYANGLLSQGMTPGAALGVAGDNAARAIQYQRGLDYQRALQEGRLEQEAGNVPWEATQAEESAFERQMGMSERSGQAGAYADARDAMAKSRRDAAMLSAWSRIEASKQQAAARRYAADATVRAHSMVGAGSFEKLVTDQEKILSANNPNMSPEQLEATARYNVLRMAQNDPGALAQQDWDRFAAMNPEGKVFNTDGSEADKKKWLSDRADAYGRAATPQGPQEVYTPSAPPGFGGGQAQQPQGAPQGQGQAKLSQQEIAASLANARAAIAKGADRNAVIQRLRQAGIPPTGL